MAGATQADRAGRDARGGPSGCRPDLRGRPIRHHPVGGTVGRSGGQSGQLARCQRDRARRHGLRDQLPERRPDPDGERAVAAPSRADHRPGGPAQAARSLLSTLLRHDGRLDLLWVRSDRPIPTRRDLRRPHPQGREACRPAGASTDQVRVDDQPQDRQGARPRSPADAARPRRRGDRMRRREFITLLGGAAAWPLAARAQQPTMLVIGYLSAVSPDGDIERLRAFRQGLKEAGYVEGENVIIEYRWADHHIDRLPALAADLVRQRVAVIVATGGTLPPLAAKSATTTIPIVFGVGDDPVRLGLVASLARPGGNATGISFFLGELTAKRLELLRELVPAAARVALLVNPANAARTASTIRDANQAAQAMALQVKTVTASSNGEIHAAFESLARERPDVLFVGSDPLFSNRRVQLATLTARHGLPASFASRDNVEAGGLTSYGTNLS